MAGERLAMMSEFGFSRSAADSRDSREHLLLGTAKSRRSYQWVLSLSNPPFGVIDFR